MDSKINSAPEHDEVEQFGDSEAGAEPKDATTIYEDGKVLAISIDEIKNNKVAIRQLVNEHNLAQSERRSLIKALSKKEAEIEFLKTGTFVSIVALLINTAAVIVIGIGVNLLTGTESQAGIGLWLVIVGGLISFFSNLSTVLYPYARAFFNRGN